MGDDLQPDDKFFVLTEEICENFLNRDFTTDDETTIDDSLWDNLNSCAMWVGEFQKYFDPTDNHLWIDGAQAYFEKANLGDILEFEKEDSHRPENRDTFQIEKVVGGKWGCKTLMDKNELRERSADWFVDKYAVILC